MVTERLQSVEKTPVHRREQGLGAHEHNAHAVEHKKPQRVQKSQETQGQVAYQQQEKDAVLARIEEMLAQGLENAYRALSSPQKMLFKKEGEEIAEWLRAAIESKRVSSRALLQRIQEWLLIVEQKKHASPWVLQEAYLRTRSLLGLFQEKERE